MKRKTKRSKLRYKLRSKSRSKKIIKRKSKLKTYDYGLSNSKSDYSEIEISIMNKLVDILRKYEKVEMINEKDRENILEETFKVLKILNLPIHTDKLFTDSIILIWYIIQIPDSKEDIKLLIYLILKKIKPQYSEVEISIMSNLLYILEKYEKTETIYVENILIETVKTLKRLNLSIPTYKLFTDSIILIWYITQIPDSKEDIKILIYEILKKVKPQYSDLEISIMSNLLYILEKYEKIETITTYVENILEETVKALESLNLPIPTDKLWIEKEHIGILNWYITRIPDSKKDIKFLLAMILEKANP